MYRFIAAALLTVAAPAPYKAISVRDFEIDGPQLAAQAQPIQITGAYTKMGETEALFADRVSAATATYTNSDYARGLPYVLLLTDSASHDARAAMLDCRERNDTGCTLTLRGLVTMCDQSNVFGGVRHLPCLQVYEVQKPAALPSHKAAP